MKMDLPRRKTIRLKDYDYSQAGYYFVTICIQDKKMLLWSDVGAVTDCPNLTETGKLIETALKNIETIYPDVFVDEYVIMPNHIHFILVIENGRPMVAPTVSHIIQQFKGYVTKNCRGDHRSPVSSPENPPAIWQKSYYEHVIRNEQDLREIREYIINNPTKWLEDEYYA